MNGLVLSRNAVDLNPSLQMPVLTSSERWNAERIRALAMSCDPDACVPVQLDEMRQGCARLGRWFPDSRVEAYLAMRCGSCLIFHALDG